MKVFKISQSKFSLSYDILALPKFLKITNSSLYLYSKNTSKRKFLDQTSKQASFLCFGKYKKFGGGYGIKDNNTQNIYYFKIINDILEIYQRISKNNKPLLYTGVLTATNDRPYLITPEVSIGKLKLKEDDKECLELTPETVKNDLKYFCMAPWVHLYTTSRGHVLPCCKNRVALGNLLKGDSVSSCWNSGGLKNMRVEMIQGKPVQSCSDCYSKEKLLGYSYRNWFNTYFFDKEIVNTTNTDGSVDKLNIKYIDYRISNICNLKCRMCSSHSSSAWYEDDKKIGRIIDSKVSVLDKVSNIWRSVEKDLNSILQNVERVNFAGGEPLLIDEQYKILEEIINLKKFDIDLTYNTNFSILKYKNYNILDMWKNFKHLRVKASLDGVNSVGEYIRHGLCWNTFLTNHNQLITEVPHAIFSVFCTVQIYNIFHLPEMFFTLVDLGIIKETDSMHLSFLHSPDFFDIRALAPELKQKIQNKFKLFYARIISSTKLSKELKNHYVNYFNKVITYMNEADFYSKEVNKEFCNFTRALDNIRKEKFADIFLELSDYYNI
jgi:MoaA/NifB/PqqE/SkfB family radical SAM enzyme